MKAQSVLFGRDGLVTDRAQALAELVPWKAPNTALRLADEKAAYYFTSWMFFFDGVYGAKTDFAKYGYHTTGGTSVSAEHTVIDSWGSIMPPDLFELAELTGNDNWRTVARLMWANAIQGITTDSTQLVHGQQRPVGGQNEGFFQARFTKYRPVIEAGYWNDCLPAWVGAYRMWTVDRLRAKGLKMR